MSVPDKYKKLGDFPEYYNGQKKAPYLTIFISGNHEASSHLWELYYGGWVAPNIYYMGAANVLRLGPLRIAGLSGIFNGPDYRKTHHERLPFSHRDVKSCYRVREFDTRKLLLYREQVDIGLSHDWPRGIEYFGDVEGLFKAKPWFVHESRSGTLGSPAAAYVMDRLRPPYWFSAHMHCKFTALKEYPPPSAAPEAAGVEETDTAAPSEPQQATGNPDEIDLDDEEDSPELPVEIVKTTEELLEEAEQELAKKRKQEAGEEEVEDAENPSGVSDELRAQLPASFAAPVARERGVAPGYPVPSTITNRETRFLALDKCLPGRKFMQLCTIKPINTTPPASPRSPSPSSSSPTRTKTKKRHTLHYDPDWLAITRVFAPYLKIGDPEAVPPPDLGEPIYAPMIDAGRAWVEENIVRAGKLAVPENFEHTAPPHYKGIHKEFVSFQPDEYSNPQTKAFCELVGVENLWDASEAERLARKHIKHPKAEEEEEGKEKGEGKDKDKQGGGSGRGGRGGGRGGGGKGKGRGGSGSGRGGRGGGGGRGKAKGRGGRD